MGLLKQTFYVSIFQQQISNHCIYYKINSDIFKILLLLLFTVTSIYTAVQLYLQHFYSPNYLLSQSLTIYSHKHSNDDKIGIWKVRKQQINVTKENCEIMGSFVQRYTNTVKSTNLHFITVLPTNKSNLTVKMINVYRICLRVCASTRHDVHSDTVN